MKYNCIVVLGPTACGKTRLACQLAHQFNGEIISADSRQVYKKLNIGTGKDLLEYRIGKKDIPYHLIDVCEPLKQFYLHDFISGVRNSFEDIRRRKKIPIICGGTGLYLDTLRKNFSLTQFGNNEVLRDELENQTREELLIRLRKFPEKYITHVDFNSKKRIIRAIEILDQKKLKAIIIEEELPYKPFYIGIKTSLQERRKNISLRLKHRIDNGLTDEVKDLLNLGITHERLQFLGLEYRFVSLYLQNMLNQKNFFTKLETAIHRYAKRQMTSFRKMEKEGVKINWVSEVNEATKLVSECFLEV